MNEKSQKPVHLAFLGCGFATQIHSKTLSGFKKQVRLYYASRSAEKAAQFNQKYRGAGYFDSYEKAIENSDIDVVLVATPPAQHLELTLMALRAGKHVIVEKPPFLHSTDFDLVKQEQNKSGKQVFVAENYYYKPLAFKLRKLLQDEVIGEVLFFHINALKAQKTENWRDDLNLAGGGALFEGGIHWVNFVANLGFSIELTHAYTPGIRSPLEKSILISFKFKEGPVGVLYYSWEVPSLFKGLRLSKIYGREGSITFESNGVFLIVRGRRKLFSFPGFADIAGYKSMFRDFFHTIQNNTSPQFTLQLARRDLELIEMIYASMIEKMEEVR